MQRSSQSIACSGCALWPRRRCELTNPEKSLIGTIKSRRGQ